MTDEQAAFVRTMLINSLRGGGNTLEQARAEAVRGLRAMVGHQVAERLVSEAVGWINEEAAKIKRAGKTPIVNTEDQRRAMSQDYRERAWYLGPGPNDKYWPALKRRLQSGSLGDAVQVIDDASTKVVSHCAEPILRGAKKKGLVLGYVQSGKTANYTAVMAKAADAGYRTFIVLSGMHNNLRRQTQSRIDRDLNTEKRWFRLTDTENDFGSGITGEALMAGRGLSVAVVKKNPARLRRLHKWLASIDDDVLALSPILILDDEADQATPNTARAKQERSAINKLIRDIWSEVENGTYIGYTATPFANIFMDPDDDDELYPSDFIVDLPRSGEYFGAERVFGRTSLGDADEPDDGLDMTRSIPPEEADALTPPSSPSQRATFDPEIPPSLQAAIRWFVMATAVRQARGQTEQHSSMLVHTSAYIASHFALRGQIEEYLHDLAADFPKEASLWLEQYCTEAERVPEVSQFAPPRWDEIVHHIPMVLQRVRVVADNGSSTDRLDYNRRDEAGRELSEWVIAIGGNTLSRGLTLEGLVVSYFVRTARTYDTLLQMGRWFGHRPGYEDLPRVWMPDALLDDFRFLALVEEEIRRDMRRLVSLRLTPKQFGVQVRAHPGHLEITSRNKMAHAELVRLSYSGQRHQTIVLAEGSPEVLAGNIRATRDLVQECLTLARSGIMEPTRTQFHDLPTESLLKFLARYHFHSDQPGLRRDHIMGWIRKSAPQVPWNVVVLGSSRRLTPADGEPLELGSIDLGLESEVPMVNRSPLRNPGPGTANIKSLLSQPDWVADLDPEVLGDLERPSKQEGWQEIRRTHGDGNGLLIVYAVSPHSRPIRERQQRSRRPMQAEVPLVGLGLIFPTVDHGELAMEGNYYSVRPDWEASTDEVEDETPIDTEGSREITAEDIEGLTHVL
ncbi:hypothetical protein BJF86_09575 [Serinicoccus sp. CNJ-927]|uniref:Z1 domain-containing protein n=1 Tax=Serinicoccus sp. CNJ-927 TaxID=1904970 RepID=UPI00095D13E9|nr:Z1 domain-containing protein [Serinicoccus sp. CNJ-927]OLT39252.1 hypothetical protein BJF86_09575 [Serinicoccus sp. CNJ-927]